MPKSRSGQLVDHAAPLQIAPFPSPNADLLILRYENPLYHRNDHKINDFFLWSVFVRSALFSHRLEPPCETHTSAAALRIVEPPTSSGADLAFVRHLRPYQTCNSIAMRRLPLGAHKHQISGLVRHRAIATAPRLSYDLQPTTFRMTQTFLRHTPSLPGQNPHDLQATNYERQTTNHEVADAIVHMAPNRIC
jgi:hypothetical protein